jgi:hypothetical protein
MNHWSSVKEFSCQEALILHQKPAFNLACLHEIDNPVPAHNLIKYLANIMEMDAVCHDFHFTEDA